jgi:threonyl-tRNA synthetase
VVPVSHEQHDYASHVMLQLRRALPDLQAEVDKKMKNKISCAS